MDEIGAEARIRCQCSCGKRFRVREKAAARTFTCPHCGEMVRVPAGQPEFQAANDSPVWRPTESEVKRAWPQQYSKIGMAVLLAIGVGLGLMMLASPRPDDTNPVADVAPAPEPLPVPESEPNLEVDPEPTPALYRLSIAETPAKNRPDPLPDMGSFADLTPAQLLSLFDAEPSADGDRPIWPLNHPVVRYIDALLDEACRFYLEALLQSVWVKSRV